MRIWQTLAGVRFIATYSPIITAYPYRQIIQLTQAGFCTMAYEQTEHYLIMKEFINNRGKMRKILLDE